MVTNILSFLTCCLIGLSINSQIVKPHFVTAKQGISIAPSNNNTIYMLHGIEYFENTSFSVVSENSLFLTSTNNSNIKYDMELSLGGNTHKIINNFDFYIGLQPGLKAMQTKGDLPENVIAPMINVTSGINYYSNYYFHLFLQAKYVTANTLSASIKPTNEFRLSFGLGYNLSQIYEALKK